MDEQGCPRCKTTKYRNPSLVLMVNVCGHTLCENCVELLFMRGTGSCPECSTPLRRNNFRVQQFEDSYVEKEIDIRRKILRDFNKKEADFDTLREYNDYLEMIENVIYNLANNVDVESTKKTVEQCKKENKEQITHNRPKMSEDDELLEMLIEEEKQLAEMRYQEDKVEQRQEKQLKKKNKEALIDELMFSESSAATILNRHKAELSRQAETKAASAAMKKPTNKFSTGITMGPRGFLPVPTAISVPLYTHVPVVLDLMGPVLPEEVEMGSIGYLPNIRKASEQEQGGGYKSMYACRRALHDAFGGLFFDINTQSRGSEPGNSDTPMVTS